MGKKKKYFSIFVLVVLVILFILLCLPNLISRLVLDDAFIFLRYVRNFTNGHGIVWNIGEKPVEGFSSFLYFFVLSITSFVFKLQLDNVIQILGVLCGIGSLIVTYLISKKLFTNYFTIFLPITLLTFSPFLIIWSTIGMDSILYLFLFLLCIYFYIRFRKNSKFIYIFSLCCFFLALSRSEAMVFILVTFFFELLYRMKEKKKVFDKSLIISGSIFIILYGALFIWRWSYFGHFFSNTYYVKTGGELYQTLGGLDNFWQSFKTLFVGTSVVILIPLIYLFLTKKRSWEVYYFSVLIFIISASNIFVGGDVFGVRFYLPVWGLLILLSSMTLDQFINLKKIKTYQTVLIVAAVFVSSLFAWYQNDYYQEDKRLYRNIPYYLANRESYPSAEDTNSESYYDSKTTFRAMASALNSNLKPGSSIALVAVGAIGYYSDFTIYDMVGKVDEHIAHEPFDEKYIESWRPGHDKGDGEYILEKKPDYILLYSILSRDPVEVITEDSFDYQYKSVVEIWNSSEFHEDYEFKPIQMDSGWYINLWKRKSLSSQ